MKAHGGDSGWLSIDATTVIGPENVGCEESTQISKNSVYLPHSTRDAAALASDDHQHTCYEQERAGDATHDLAPGQDALGEDEHREPSDP